MFDNPETRKESGGGGSSPWRTTFRLPLALEGCEELQGPALVSLPVDLIAALRDAGLGGVPDPASVRVVEREGSLSDGSAAPAAVPAQFSPDWVERLPLDAPGSPSWICRFPADLQAAAPDPVTVRGQVSFLWRPGALRRPALEFDVFDDAYAVQVPYPPNHFKILLADGRVPPPAFFPVGEIVPGPAGRLDVRLSGEPLLTYVYESEVRKPYFFPVYGPSGDLLTRLGHPHDPTGSHRHHRSLWIAHGDVGGIDFWHDWRPGTGAIVHRRFLGHEQGPVFVRLSEELEWQAPSTEPVLREQRTLTASGAPGGDRLLDVEITLTAARAVTIGQSPFGFLAFRVAESMTPYDGGGIVRNAEGRYNDDLCRMPSRWADFSGPVGPGRSAGIAILDHPANPQHPTPFYCRNDGWLGAAFSAGAPWELREGDALSLRYRLVLHDGSGGAGRVEAAYQGYVRPITVRAAGPAACVGRSMIQWG